MPRPQPECRRPHRQPTAPLVCQTTQSIGATIHPSAGMASGWRASWHLTDAGKALTPGVRIQRLYGATLGGRSLSLGILDCRFGQLGDPISGCDCV
jgi:hypothetical protein